MKQIKVTKKMQKYADNLYQATRGEKIDLDILQKLADDAMDLHKLLAHKKIRANFSNNKFEI
jgi:hypothetical protein